MDFVRSSGILLHPTSFPGPYGIGDIGPAARSWVDFLAETGTGLWQTLPLGPTGYGDSPYQCFSTFAGNPYLISPDILLQDNLLHPDDLDNLPDFPSGVVEYGDVIYWKLDLLSRSYDRFRYESGKKTHKEAGLFYTQNDGWLNDYAVFMALKEFHGGKPWSEWPTEYRERNQHALDNFIEEHSYAVQKQKYFQFLFFKQWKDLRDYANARNVKIIGDLPIFIAHDSTDAWAHQELFNFDSMGNPTVVAGVPPDYFSETGQLWGNPLYHWEKHTENDYAWWMDRLRAAFRMADIVRLDHGFG